MLPSDDSAAARPYVSTRTTGGAGFHMPDAARVWIAGRDDRFQYVIGAIGRAGDQQPARCLRIGEKLSAPVGKTRRQTYGFAIALPVPARCPGHQTLLRQPGGVGQERQIVQTNDQGSLRAPRHLQGMPEQAETGHIGDGVHRCVLRQARSDAVEQRRRCDHLGVGVGTEHALLQGRGIDADTKRLGEDHRVARLGVGIAAHILGAADADDDEAVVRQSNARSRSVFRRRCRPRCRP